GGDQLLPVMLACGTALQQTVPWQQCGDDLVVIQQDPVADRRAIHRVEARLQPFGRRNGLQHVLADGHAIAGAMLLDHPRQPARGRRRKARSRRQVIAPANGGQCFTLVGTELHAGIVCRTVEASRRRWILAQGCLSLPPFQLPGLRLFMSSSTSPSIATRQRLTEVRYEIRGELARRARELEAQGRQLIKLNIGNPGAFGFRAPEHLQRAIADNIGRSDPYGHQQGLPEAREAIAAQQQARGAHQVSAERVFIGNGVSELIDMSLRALLNPGDEVLLPSPDYPLWTAATLLNDGVAEHYPCAAANGFLPDPAQVESQITPRTRALVLINPNNPTGAVYPRELLEELV